MAAGIINKTRIDNRLPVAREGLPFIAAGAFLTSALAFIGQVVLSATAGILTLFVIYFFRDPERTPPESEGVVLSPADGRVISIEDVEESGGFLDSACLRVSIFMTVFNVHVNRMVTGGRIESVEYRPGRFLSANLDKASEENERNRIILITPEGRRLGVVQVAGLIARRIACWVEAGDTVAAGQRFGLIRFGSRLDVYLPRGTSISAAVGDKVKAGESILGRL